MNTLFFLVAVAFSLFYALKCKEIWFPDANNMTKSRKFHEQWFNFVGSVVGWISLYFIYKSLASRSPATLIDYITWQHVFLMIVGLLGITGLLPYCLWSMSRAFDQIMNKFISRK